MKVRRLSGGGDSPAQCRSRTRLCPPVRWQATETAGIGGQHGCRRLRARAQRRTDKLCDKEPQVRTAQGSGGGAFKLQQHREPERR
eukprot:874920-Pleurochrysis_carterae.AAC.3